ncbi:secretion protein EspV [Acidovorax sp. SUPP3434]|uniref:secretion protein EspV n=1 Tax=Acidovorax sp. SUPP3434 TaxID=2920880 RepID=UPI0023DE4082|nr:secretion protein EspV [Acidovorax sp. SUPP3434]GKT01152.1 secretion protein EspV [Acidovorax sp. SUPP3434]
MTEQTPSAIRQFLSRSLSNNRYDSISHLHRRAEVYLANIGAEKALIDTASLALKDPATPAAQQSAWLCHLERGLWESEEALESRDRQRLGDEAQGHIAPSDDSPYKRPKAWTPSPASSAAFAMMLKGESGPFTWAQAQTGFETAQEGQLLAGRLKLQDRVTFRAENRHDATRSGTHPTKTLDGADLSHDAGTHLRDALGVPVMTGTSGSSSDVAIAMRYGAQKAESSWAAPGLSQEEAKKALIDLALHFFRTEGSNPPAVLAKGMNGVRAQLGLPDKQVEAAEVFAHSYPEIHAAVSLTVDGIDPRDPVAVEQALREYTLQAKRRLDGAKLVSDLSSKL